MRRVAFYVLAGIAAPLAIAAISLALGFGLTLGWLVGDDES